MQLAKNNFFASTYFNQLLFGKDHPYGRYLKVNVIHERSLSEIYIFFQLEFQNDPKVILCGDIDDNVIEKTALLLKNVNNNGQ